MENLLSQLQQTCHTTTDVRVWAYGYLDAIVSQYANEAITEQELRRHHYQLTAAVETHMLALRREVEAEELRLRAKAMENLRGKSAAVTDS